MPLPTDLPSSETIQIVLMALALAIACTALIKVTTGYGPQDRIRRRNGGFR